MKYTTLNILLEETATAFSHADLYYGHGTDNPWDEAVALALFVFDLAPNVDASVGERKVTSQEEKAYRVLVNRRIKERMPVPYLTQTAYFANRKFYVDERVIIPRSPIAELILSDFQPFLGERTVHRVLDLCTGSGCIAIATALQLKNVIVDAVDISDAALAVAQKNRTLHQCEKKVNLIKGDVFSACTAPYDLIISNPPYVDRDEMRRLPEEYHWEPRLALAAGDDGLSIVKTILKKAAQFLTEEGLLIVEVGDSKKALQKAYSNLPFQWLKFNRGGSGVFLLRKKDLIC